jgi:hypothetical protein
MTARTVLLAWLVAVGCAEPPSAPDRRPEADDEATSVAPAVEGARPGIQAEPDEWTHLVATDIDETLTLTNDEWAAQVHDPTYDPEMRPDANTLLRGYADLGYRIVYVTARYEGFDLLDGRSATEATVDWLEAHDFPLEAGSVFLSPSEDTSWDAVVAFKTDVLETLHAAGAVTDFAYGNATTDIEAFLAAGAPIEATFHVGEDEADLGAVPIPDDEAYTVHLEEQLPGVPEVGDF